MVSGIVVIIFSCFLKQSFYLAQAGLKFVIFLSQFVNKVLTWKVCTMMHSSDTLFPSQQKLVYKSQEALITGAFEVYFATLSSSLLRSETKTWLYAPFWDSVYYFMNIRWGYRWKYIQDSLGVAWVELMCTGSFSDLFLWSLVILPTFGMIVATHFYAIDLTGTPKART